MPSIIFGHLGKDMHPSERKFWNAFFLGQEIEACFHLYPTQPHDIPLRLSEMFLHDRRGYTIGAELGSAMTDCMDVLDVSAKKTGKVDTVFNDGGVIKGFDFSLLSAEGRSRKRLQVWKMSDPKLHKNSS